MTNKGRTQKRVWCAPRKQRWALHPAPARERATGSLTYPREVVPRVHPGAPALAALRERNNPAVPSFEEGRLRRPVRATLLHGVPNQEASVEREFRGLATRWRRETEHLSSTDVFTHPDYQRIIGLGSRVVPHLLLDLSTTGAHWFWALRAITGENPVAAEDAGNVRKMIQAWLAWGEARGMV